MSSDSAEFAAIMPQVAEIVFGELAIAPNKHMSSSTETRYGTNGSISVDHPAGTYFDHEDQIGGGVLDLLRAFKGYEKPEALEWLQERGFIKRREKANGINHGANGASPQGKFAGFMDDWPVATFEYFDDRGRLAYEVLKFAKTAPRRYMQRRRHPAGGWIWGLQEGLYGKTRGGDWFKAKAGKHYEAEEHIDEAVRWLYRRDDVLAAIKAGKPVVLVEGEKDVETLRAWGQVATTNAGGAKYWTDAFDDELAGADIVICGDNDDASRQRTLLRGAGLKPRAKSVRVLDLAQHWKEMPEKADVSDWKDNAGGTPEKFAALLKKAPHWTPVRPRDFGAYYHDEIDGPGLEYDYLIDGLLTARGRSVIGGPSGSGKSFLALHAAYCIARPQQEFFGRVVEHGGVIYQAGEGGLGMKKRQKAYRKHFQVPEGEDIPLVVLPAKVDLFAREGDTDRLISTIKAIKITMSVPLRVVFIDTLATATIGADENSGKDMSVVLSNIARIEQECGVHVCLVHHMNADGKKLRGHTSIHANVDTVVLVTMDDSTKIRTAKLTKQKDDEDGLKIPFTLASVAVGHNPKTDREITSCVVLTVSEKDALKKEQQQFGYSVRPTEEALLIPMFKAIKKYGRFVADEKEGPSEAVGKHVVDFGHFLDVAVEMDASDNDKTAAKAKIRKSFERNTNYLIKHQVIAFKRVTEKTALLWWTGRPIRGFPDTFPPEMRNRTNSPQSSDKHAPNSPPPISEGMAEMIDSDQDIQL